MKRRIFIAAIFLLAGVVVNVAVGSLRPLRRQPTSTHAGADDRQFRWVARTFVVLPFVVLFVVLLSQGLAR